MSVCPSAFGFPAHNCFPFTPITMTLHMQTPHEARMCPIDFEVKRSKVKVKNCPRGGWGWGGGLFVPLGQPRSSSFRNIIENKDHYRIISGIFCVSLIFAEFATFLKSPKINTGKNKPYYTSSLRVLEIAKIELLEYLKHLPNDIFAKKFPTRKIPEMRYF